VAHAFIKGNPLKIARKVEVKTKQIEKIAFSCI
jgi:hypothetical protein